MKKTLFFIIAVLLMCISPVHADTFENSAFIGEWTSPKATDTDYARLHIDYCDSSVINAHFKQVKDGVQKYDYTVYQGKVKDNEAELDFDAYAAGTTELAYSGKITLAWYIDNIWVSIYTNGGEEIYNGMVVTKTDGFNPYASPFSYNVKINLNGEDLKFNKTPAIINGTTFVPLRGTFDAMNLNVYWDDFTSYNKHYHMITATKGNEIIEIKRELTSKGTKAWQMKKWSSDLPDTLDDNFTTVNIEDIQPIIINESSYVPLRVIAESFGADVEWDGSTNTVNITYDTSCDTKKTQEDIKEIEAFNSEKAFNMVKSFYTTMRSLDYPYYNYKVKYYLFNCTRDDVNLVALVDHEGNTLEYTAEEWENMQ